MEEKPQLLPGARIFWATALQSPTRFGHQETGLHHLLYTLLERYGPMAEALAPGVKSVEYRDQLREKLQTGDIGTPVVPEALLQQAVERAQGQGKPQASERDLAAVILEQAGWKVNAPPIPVMVKAPEVTGGDVQPPTIPLTTPAPAEASDAVAPQAAGYRPRAQQPTPTLEHYGRDLCHEAAAGKLPPILGRDLELQAMMETLCRFTKRNPLLVGPAGVGKTAIAEALAQRIVAGDVPAPLQGLRIFLLQPSALVSGASMMGEIEKRMQAIVKEASQDGIVLFIDEIHTIVGSGGARQVSDLSSLLKPALAKGDLACIGATTDEEFNKFIEQDRALERRFQPLRVQELSTEATLEILRSLRTKAERERQVTLPEASLQLIILLAQQYLRNRRFPDKAIDILEQSIAFAMLQGYPEVTAEHVRNVVKRMTGIPVDLGAALSQRLSAVREALVTQAFCPEEAAEKVTQRLEITMRGLDVGPLSPNAVLLVAGTPAEAPELAAQVLDQTLYGEEERIIEVDMARFTHPSDVTWLTGAPPGYVGHDKPTELHLQLAQHPWAVLLFRNVEASHPQVQEVLAQALKAGFFTDAQGRNLYLSDAIVFLTVTAETHERRVLGFGREAGAAEPAENLLKGLPLVPDLLAQVDCAWQPLAPNAERLRTWLNDWVLPPLTQRYAQQGLDIQWDAEVVAWLAQCVLETGDLNQGERLVEQNVLPALIPYLSTPSRLRVVYHEGLSVEPRPDES